MSLHEILSLMTPWQWVIVLCFPLLTIETILMDIIYLRRRARKEPPPVIASLSKVNLREPSRTKIKKVKLGR